MLNAARLSHAYIAGTDEFSQEIALISVCSAVGNRPCGMCSGCNKAAKGLHPDIAVTQKQPGAREIVVDQIRALGGDVYILPNEAQKKVYIIKEAHDMNTAAQNALLRILEEPPPYVVFVLVTGTQAALLPTVRSRCVALGAKHTPVSIDSTLAGEFFAAMAAGRLELAEFSFRLDKLDKTEFAEFISAARMLAAKLLSADMSGDPGALSRVKLAEADRALSLALEMLELNVGTGHISGMLCASLL